MSLQLLLLLCLSACQPAAAFEFENLLTLSSFNMFV